LYCVLAGLVFAVALTRSASAAIVVDIDRSIQRMAVTVDGVPRYNWRVSTARRGYITPPGTYHPEMLARHWFSLPQPCLAFGDNWRRGFALAVVLRTTRDAEESKHRGQW
jgi:lipoprotein-anchoring transpeptidase ErfK/SrfK